MYKSIILSLLLLMSACIDQPSEQEMEGFEILNIDDSLLDEMIRKGVFGSQSPVLVDRLKLLKVRHYGFDNREYEGELMVLDACSEQVLSIFQKLYARQFPIAKINLITAYAGSDSLSMADNNTSAHNLRPVAGGERLSLHAYGTAIDLNPVQNPFVAITCDDSIGIARFQPAAGIHYANRREDRPGKQNRSGMAEEVIDIFARRGFYVWGGYWNCPIDYQHFQVSRSVTELLVHMKNEEAYAFFNKLVLYYNRHQKPIEEEMASRIGEGVSLVDFYLSDSASFNGLVNELN